MVSPYNRFPGIKDEEKGGMVPFEKGQREAGLFQIYWQL
jgi:hypothetical protein